MIVLAIAATLAALGYSVVAFIANGMRDAPGKFQGRPSLIAAWLGTAVMWLAWWFS